MVLIQKQGIKDLCDPKGSQRPLRLKVNRQMNEEFLPQRMKNFYRRERGVFPRGLRQAQADAEKNLLRMAF